MRYRKGAGEELRDRYGEAPGGIERGRLRVVFVCALLLFCAIAVRLGQLHLNPRMELSEEERHHIGKLVLKQPRGNIYDREGLVLATDRKVPSLWADPRRVEDPAALARAVAGLLGITEQEVLERLKPSETGTVRKFVWLKRWLTEIPETQLLALVDAWPGLHIEHEPLRYYPQQQTAAHVLGFVNRAGEASEGIELAFNEYLESVPGVYMARKDNNRTLLPSRTIMYQQPEGGADLHLTLDTTLQHSLEDALDRRMTECNANRAMGLIMDPKTGAILALATRPAFDPNAYDKFPAELRKNSALIDVFEPGSVFKIVTASAALQHGLVTPETMIDCEGGSFNPYGHRIKDFHKLGVEPFSKCFAESSNIALIKLGGALGPERLDQWIQAYGFGRPTSPHFTIESRGIYQTDRKKWSRLTMGSLPMGQEIAVTMPQLARSFAVIANGGSMVEPYVVERVVGKDGAILYQHEPMPPTRLLSPETAQTMQELCHLVTIDGTGERALIPEYRIGGKTGTAQIARKDGRGYEPDKFTTVFAGFAPVADPRLVAVIVVQEPMIDLHYGGYVCGPVFKEVVREALIRMDVPFDPVTDPEALKRFERERKERERLLAIERREQKKQETKQSMDQSQVARAAAIAAEAAASLEAADADTVVPRITVEEMEESLAALLEPLDGLDLGAGDPSRSGLLPDLRGMSKRQVHDTLAQLGIPWDPRGAGWVINQDPEPNTALSNVTVCKVEFGPRTQAEVQDDPETNLRAAQAGARATR